MHSIVGGRPTVWLAIAGLLLTASIAQSAVTIPDPQTKSPAATTSAAKPATSRKTTPRKPEIRSGSIFVIDESDSSVLLSKNANVAVPIASITKLMTALVVLEAQQPLDEPIKITNEDRAIDKGAPSRLNVGATLTRGELLHLALMSSENRAANAVGRNYPGGIKGLLHAMNEKAKSLGMKRTHFADATGLSNANIASPADLSKLVIAVSENPTIREFSTDPDHAVAVGKYTVEYRNTNTLVRKPEWDILVQKTGYTQAAGRCLVMKTIIEDRPVVMVLMNSFGKYTRVADAARIRRWMEAGSAHSQMASSGS